MNRTLLLAAVVLALGLQAADAGAAPFTPQMDRAYEMSNDYWGEPAPGCSSVDRQIVPSGTLPGGAMGWATLPMTGEVTPCVIYIDRWLAKPIRFYAMCRVVFHEDGHNHGLPDTDIAGDLMNSTVVAGSIPRACWREGNRVMRWID